jgi:hypothetical protein
MTNRFTAKCLIVLLAAAAAASAKDKEPPKFTPLPIEQYPCRQTNEKLTIAAAPFSKETDTQKAFGKLNPNRYGVLPILVVMRNDSGQAISLEGLKIEFIMPTRDHVEATPAADIRFLRGPDRPKVYTAPVPKLPPVVGKQKNPLDQWEIEGRAFAARAVMPHDTASGFFYFRAPYMSGSKLLLTGIREAASGRELFYFEIPLDPQ